MKRGWIFVLVTAVVLLGAGWWLGWWDFYGNFGGAKEIRERGVQMLSGQSVFVVDKNAAGYENFLKTTQGCPTRDCIPALTKPKLVGVEESNSWLEDNDLIVGVDYGGEHRAYPVKILNWHEVVDDIVAGEPVAVTWSPLTGSAAMWSRKVGGNTLTFKVSGRLFNSNTVMYDKETGSLWQQITGEAIVGKLMGTKLEQIPVVVGTWGTWKGRHRETKVLSWKTGYERNYNEHPYGTYEDDEAMYFPVEGEIDKTIEPKTVIYGLVASGGIKAYTLDAIERDTKDDSVINDRIGNQRIRISYNYEELFVEDLSAKGEIIPRRMYWFAWKAFYPQSDIYK